MLFKADSAFFNHSFGRLVGDIFSRLRGAFPLNILGPAFASSYFIVVLFSGVSAHAREHIWAAGSSTVYPFITTAAEHFGRRTEFRTPIIESTGTGGGLKLFCGGAGKNTPDMANASRAIKDSEIALCAKNGVTNIIPIKIGLDGIVFANSVNAEHMNLSRKQIFLALAKYVPVNGRLVENPYKNWNDIDKKLPAHAIAVFGPPPTSGTRDAFVELVMHHACEDMPEFAAAYPDKKKRGLACGMVREDGAYQESGEDDNLLIQKLAADPKALGIFGYSFLEENADKVQGSTIDGTNPTYDNVSQGHYTVTRPLFIYVKGEHLDIVPGIRDFMRELAREGTIGEEGYLAEKGLIPLLKTEREALRKRVISIADKETAPAPATTKRGQLLKKLIPAE